MLVDQVPIMEDSVISSLAKSVGMLNGTIMGMTFGHSIYIARGFESTRLYSHEFRHVHQYETFGSLEAFMEEYLHQVLTFGYSKAPLELDAEVFEVEGVWERSVLVLGIRPVSEPPGDVIYREA